MTLEWKLLEATENEIELIASKLLAGKYLCDELDFYLSIKNNDWFY